MKPHLIAIFGATVLTFAGCATRLERNDQQAYATELAEARVMMATLRALDTGDVDKTRRIALFRVNTGLLFLPEIAAKAHPTPAQSQEELTMARDILAKPRYFCFFVLALRLAWLPSRI